MLNEELIKKLETPCIVIELDKAKENIRQMQEIADRNRVSLRPHIKTHKMQKFANLQLKYGAVGITCAKVSEAEIMADGGINDIFIAYPMVGEFRVDRAIKLAQRIDRLILAVDSEECACKLNSSAKTSGITIEVRLEVDTGAGRTGVLLKNAVKLAIAISQMSNLKLSGIYTFKGLVLKNTATTDNTAAGDEEGELLEYIANKIREHGIEIAEISAGSSPTGETVAATGKVTEIRPGTYIFKDYMLYKEGVAKLDEIAAHVYATVVSTPNDEYAVIDGGTKTFCGDVSLNTPPFYYEGYAVVEGDYNLVLSRMNEEHGILTAKNGKTELKVGQVLKLIPVHICTAVNLQNEVYIYDNGNISKHRVDARGMLV